MLVFVVSIVSISAFVLFASILDRVNRGPRFLSLCRVYVWFCWFGGSIPRKAVMVNASDVPVLGFSLFYDVPSSVISYYLAVVSYGILSVFLLSVIGRGGIFLIYYCVLCSF